MVLSFLWGHIRSSKTPFGERASLKVLPSFRSRGYNVKLISYTPASKLYKKMSQLFDQAWGHQAWTKSLGLFLLGRREVAHVLAQGHICDMITFLLLPATFFVGTQERKQPEETNLLQTGSKLWLRFLLTLFVLVCSVSCECLLCCIRCGCVFGSYLQL